MKSPQQKNLSLAINLGVGALGMLMLAYASVPLYRLFCDVTGFGGIAKQAETRASIPVLDRKITVQFDANVDPALDWKFHPAQRDITLNIGQKKTVEYIATNNDNAISRGTATFNVTPVKAGKYFHKVQCFCFTDQELAAQETKHMAILFYMDPDMAKDPDLDDVSTITLSYTFFPLKK